MFLMLSKTGSGSHEPTKVRGRACRDLDKIPFPYLPKLSSKQRKLCHNSTVYVRFILTFFN